MKILSGYHPAVILISFMSVISIAMFVENPVIQLISLVGALLYMITIKGRHKIVSTLKYLSVVFIVVSLSNPLFVSAGTTVLMTLGRFRVTFESLMYGISAAVMITAVILWFICYSTIMTSDKFIGLFGRIIPKISLILTMSLKFVPELIKRAKKIGQAQKVMGMSGGNFKKRISNAMQNFTVLLSVSLEHSIDTSATMKAMGYGLKSRTSYFDLKFKRSDALAVIAVTLLTLITFLGVGLRAVSFEFYPYLYHARITALTFATYTAYLLLSLLPAIIEFNGRLKWKYCVSAI